MDFTRTFDTIVAVWTDMCDVVFLTKENGKFRMLGEHMHGSLKETRDYVAAKLGRRVKILGFGKTAEMIFEL